MTETHIVSNIWRTGLSTLAGLSLCLQSPIARSQELIEVQATKSTEERVQAQSPELMDRTRVNHDTYILGPGDGLQIELLDLPELSGNFYVGPDGSIYLPRLRALNVEGLTVEELRTLLTKQFRTYVRDPQVYIRPVTYRPIRVYVGGEVKRPGYYTLSGESRTEDMSEIGSFPTVFDAIRTASGVTPYSDLSKVQVVRKRAEGLGGGRIRTDLNFLTLITEGNESQNIRLLDGDSLTVRKSPNILRDQLLKALQSNLSPLFVEVFVVGRVNDPGGIKIPQGSSLNQAIALAGGTKFLKGKIEFVRFNREGTIDRRIFAYNSGASADTPSNPILASGDLIRVNESILTGTVNALDEITSPFRGIYSMYSLFF